MYENDIPLQLATSSHQGTSFSPERRGESERKSYAEQMAAAHEKMRHHATKGGTLDALESEFAAYRERVRELTLAYLSSRSRCISWMITGRSGFPVSRAQKWSAAADKRLNELIQGRTKAMQRAVKNLRPDLRPIMSGDSDACERLTEEIAQAETLQARMKAVNAAHKRYLKDPASLDKSGLSETDKARVIAYKPEYSWEPHPFAPYQLTNNNANIRRMRQRLDQLKAAKAAPVATVESESGITMEDDPPNNRVRLFFPSKPDPEIRSRLKSSGFRWAPSVGAWQAYRNHRTIELAKEMAA